MLGTVMPTARISLVFLAAFAPLFAAQQTNTVASEFVVEPPTLVSLGFDGKISGDDNRNARVEVAYRRAGETQWRNALPMLRLQHESVLGGTANDGGGHYFSYVAPNMFSRSILNLRPDTEYECQFVLSDPDGVKGKVAKMVTVRTRKEPEPAQDGHTYHVYPFGYNEPSRSQLSPVCWQPITWVPTNRIIST